MEVQRWYEEELLEALEVIEEMLISQKYIDTILEKNVKPAFEEFKDHLDWFAEDNDPKHSGSRGAYLTRNWFLNNPDIPRIDWLIWLPCSPDLNPIENLWNTLQKSVCRVNNRKKENLFNIAEKIWIEIPTETIWGLIDSMPRRIEAVIKANGEKYKILKY